MLQPAWLWYWTYPLETAVLLIQRGVLLTELHMAAHCMPKSDLFLPPRVVCDPDPGTRFPYPLAAMSNEVPDTRSIYISSGFLGLRATPTFAELDRVGVTAARWPKKQQKEGWD